MALKRAVTDWKEKALLWKVNFSDWPAESAHKSIFSVLLCVIFPKGLSLFTEWQLVFRSEFISSNHNLNPNHGLWSEVSLIHVSQMAINKTERAPLLCRFLGALRRRDLRFRHLRNQIPPMRVEKSCLRRSKWQDKRGIDPGLYFSKLKLSCLNTETIWQMLCKES